jgi:hypothetical protein
MKPTDQHQRQAASQCFQQSLNQLEDILQENTTGSEIKTKTGNANTVNSSNIKNQEIIDLAALEDAVADIEKFLQQKQSKS